MDAVSRIERLVAPSLEALGFAVVRVKLLGGSTPTLQIMAERADGSMSVEDCAEVSRTVSALLDVEDPISGHYMLEVSSPGIDRPLTRPVDYERYAGFEAKIELSHPLQGRKRFRGLLLGLDGENVKLNQEGTEVALPLSDISTAKLVLTEALIAASQPDQLPQ